MLEEEKVIIRDLFNKVGQGVFAYENFDVGDTVISSKVVAEFKLPTKWTVENNKRHYLLSKPFIQVNHSCSPNCKVIWDGEICRLVSLKNIRKDEEITFDYQVTESKITAFSTCLCGTENCRNLISGNSDLNLNQDILDFPDSNHIEELRASRLSVIDSLMNKRQLFFRGREGVIVDHLMDLMKQHFYREYSCNECVLSRLSDKNLKDFYVAFTPYALERINGNDDLKTTLDIYPEKSSSFRYYKDRDSFMYKEGYIDKKFSQCIQETNSILLNISFQILQFIVQEELIDLGKDFLDETRKNPNYLMRLIHYRKSFLEKNTLEKNTLALAEHVDDDLFAIVFNTGQWEVLRESEISSGFQASDCQQRRKLLKCLW